MRTSLGLALAIVLAFADGSTAGPPEHSGRQHQMRVSIPRIESEVTIDGILDETVWREAARLKDFSQYFPADGQPANDDGKISYLFRVRAGTNRRPSIRQPPASTLAIASG